MDVLTLMKKRYSCREFEDRQITDEQLNAVLEVARLSPSARNLQPARLCVVQSPEGLAKIDECTKCRYGAPTVIIAAYDHDVSSHPSDGRGPETCDFGDIDTTIALTNIDAAAAEQGLGACWVGAFDHARVRELFNVPESYCLVELFMLGYPKAQPSERHGERRSLDELVCHESF